MLELPVGIFVPEPATGRTVMQLLDCDAAVLLWKLQHEHIHGALGLRTGMAPVTACCESWLCSLHNHATHMSAPHQLGSTHKGVGVKITGQPRSAPGKHRPRAAMGQERLHAAYLQNYRPSARTLY